MDFMKSRVWGKVMLSVSNDMDLPEEEKVFGLAMIGEQFLNNFRQESTEAEKAAEQSRKKMPKQRRRASVDNGNSIAAILEIVRLAMKINASEKTEVQAFVSISPHISEVQVDIYNSGWSYDTYPNVTYRARYDFSHQADETMTDYIQELKITNVNCNVDYMQKKLCELVTKEVERNG